MKQVIQHFRSGVLRVEEVPETICQPGGILVSNVSSLISAGTEKMAIDLARRSLVGKARERPDLVRQVMQKIRRDGLASTLQTVRARLETPLALGYSCAGIVREVGRGVTEFQVGDRVACAGMNYASHAETVFVPKNLAVRIPGELSFDHAAFVTLGAIALQGVRTAEVRLGESVAVIGLGLLGQLTLQILKSAGCKVVGIDLDPVKIDLALTLGADAACLRSGDVTGTVSRQTDGAGVDAVIITAAAETNDPVELAALIARDRAIVSVVGAVGMNLPRKPYYEKELQLRTSRSYGPGRYDRQYEELGIDYPIGYVRWTERRNMQEFLRLAANRSIDLDRLISHRFPIEEAEKAYGIITTPNSANSGAYLGILLGYRPAVASPSGPGAIRLPASDRQRRNGSIGLGMIGAGNFAKSVLLPRIAARKQFELIGIATATGKNALAIGTQFGFRNCTTDYRELLGDPDIDAIIIATRHESHARMVTAALEGGKAVFVEKPLAIDAAGLQSVTEAATPGGRVLVGFNRRYAPLSVEMKRFLGEAGPLAISYRVNAGMIPRESWIQGDEGGGRIIGECCHFVDLMQFLTGADPIGVYAVQHPDGPDTLSAVIRFSDGSIGSLNYFANGDRSLPKERIEAFAGSRTAVLDDFRSLELRQDGKQRTIRKSGQDKGFDAEIGAFLNAIQTGGPMPISLESQILTTRATFAIEESMRTGKAVTL
jgi:predicted dehydrogenase/threonine dehydrogenase-like Zn-dependent dehydrogenase